MKNLSSVFSNVLLPSSSLNNLGVTLVADKSQIQNLKAQMRNLEANLGVPLWYLFAELHIETVYTIYTITQVHWFAVRSIGGCGLRLFGKMSTQRKHRSKGRVLGTQGLWAELQVLAQSSYLGQIRLCHLSRRAAELSWRTRRGEETRRTLFCRPRGARVSCRKHLKLILLMSERETVSLGVTGRRKHWNKFTGVTLQRNSSSREGCLHEGQCPLRNGPQHPLVSKQTFQGGCRFRLQLSWKDMLCSCSTNHPFQGKLSFYRQNASFFFFFFLKG